MGGKATCLFLPGLPGPRKDYLLLNDLRKFGITVDWLTYTGTYECKDQGRFSLHQVVIDIIDELEKREKARQPYFIVAYSFSTWAIRQVDISRLKYCQAILLFSPILSLSAADICTDFVALVHGLGRAGDIAIDSTDFTQARDVGRAEEFSSWLREVAKQKIPVFSFSSQRDKSGLSTEQIQKITRSLPLSSNEYVRLFTEESATHNLDSYYDTMARSVLWGTVAASEYVRLLGEDSRVYLWGSLVGISSWSPDSDIDVLLIANLGVEDYKNIVKIAQAIETASGIHLGISVNRPSDLKRRDFIRQNRGAIFLYELYNEAIPFAAKVRKRRISRADLKADALIENKIIRAQIAKELVRYYRDTSVSKRIIKNFIQAVRVTAYTNGCKKVASLDQALVDDDLRCLIGYALNAKMNGYQDVTFDKLYDMAIALGELVERQEKLR